MTVSLAVAFFSKLGRNCIQIHASPHPLTLWQHASDPTEGSQLCIEGSANHYKPWQELSKKIEEEEKQELEKHRETLSQEDVEKLIQETIKSLACLLNSPPLFNTTVVKIAWCWFSFKGPDDWLNRNEPNLLG